MKERKKQEQKQQTEFEEQEMKERNKQEEVRPKKNEAKEEEPRRRSKEEVIPKKKKKGLSKENFRRQVSIPSSFLVDCCSNYDCRTNYRKWKAFPRKNQQYNMSKYPFPGNELTSLFLFFFFRLFP